MKRFLLLTLTVMASVGIHAQKYFPEGTKWAEEVVELGMPIEKRIVKEYVIGSETLIGGLVYKKVLENGSEIGLWIREDGEKVFLLSQDLPQEILLYDFNWEGVTSINQSYLLETDNGFSVSQEVLDIQNKGIVSWSDKEYNYYKQDGFVIIEGIGRIMERDRNSCLLGYKKAEMILPGILYHKLLWLTKNDDLVYQSELAEEWLTSILSNLPQIIISKDENSEEILYDLQGRPVSQPSKGVYIENGRKRVVR